MPDGPGPPGFPALFGKLVSWPVVGRIRGHSMSPTFRDGQLVLIDRLSIAMAGIRRRQVVVLSPARPGGEREVKRVVGLPGESLRLEEGRVWIDDSAAEEPYLADGPRTRGLEEGHWDIGNGEVYLLGDNRPHSTDSRSYGPVAITRIEAVARRLGPIRFGA